MHFLSAFYIIFFRAFSSSIYDFLYLASFDVKECNDMSVEYFYGCHNIKPIKRKLTKQQQKTTNRNMHFVIKYSGENDAIKSLT